MGLSSRNHGCQGAEKTHDRNVSSAEETLEGGPGRGHRDFQAGFDVRMFSVFSQCSPPLLSQRDYKENVDPDQLMIYDTKETFPDCRSFGPPC